MFFSVTIGTKQLQVIEVIIPMVSIFVVNIEDFLFTVSAPLATLSLKSKHP